MDQQTAIDFEHAVAEAIDKDGGDYHDYKMGRYHPSHISGCPLGTVIDFMTEDETPVNNHIFNGKTAHYYLQERNIIDRALHDIGYHYLDTRHEVSNHYNLKETDDDARIVGRCDTISSNGDDKLVIDLKYSSLKPEYNNNRLLKYAAQINAYAHMFDADKWVLLFVYSKADDLTDPESINTMVSEPNEDVWQMMLDKAYSIHDALKHFNWDEGNRWEVEELKQKDRDFWEEVMQFFEEEWVPAYDGELKWSDRDEWVMPYMDKWSGTPDSGIASFKS